MAVDPELAALMTETVQLASPSSRDGYGEITYGSNTAAAARIVSSPDVMRSEMGVDFVDVQSIWLDDDYGVTQSWRVTLPDGSTPEIAAVESYPDENGSGHHQRILCGRRRA